jgi:hypothetical protein
MNWQDLFGSALGYDEFLTRHGQPAHRVRWQSVYDRVSLTETQRALVHGFVREMHVLCLAGAWCGDCVNQCPIFQRIAQCSASIVLRFIDRDVHAQVQRELRINGGDRVPVLIFLSEDYQEVARYGDRTLAQYRQLARDQLGASCPSGIVVPQQDLVAAMVQDWLNEFERVQLLLRLSPRLRQKHGD